MHRASRMRALYPAYARAVRRFAALCTGMNLRRPAARIAVPVQAKWMM
jgi:hypothetical protein